MVKFLTLISLSLATVALASPMQKRISQTTEDSTKKFDELCKAAGGDPVECRNLRVSGAAALQPETDNCQQQFEAEKMIILAKKLQAQKGSNINELVNQIRIYVQQPSNSFDNRQRGYCRKPTSQPELGGLFRCQFAGTVGNGFSGKPEEAIPLSRQAPVNPVGSCVAFPGGPVPDGEQLSALVANAVGQN